MQTKKETAGQEIVINRPIETVWRYATSLAKYHRWRPGLSHYGNLPRDVKRGSTFAAVVHETGGRSKEHRVVVAEYDPPYCFSMIDQGRCDTYNLTAVDENRTRLDFVMKKRGWRVGPVGALLSKLDRFDISFLEVAEKHAKAFADYCESQWDDSDNISALEAESVQEKVSEKTQTPAADMKLVVSNVQPLDIAAVDDDSVEKREEIEQLIGKWRLPRPFSAVDVQDRHALKVEVAPEELIEAITAEAMILIEHAEI